LLAPSLIVQVIQLVNPLSLVSDPTIGESTVFPGERDSTAAVTAEAAERIKPRIVIFLIDEYCIKKVYNFRRDPPSLVLPPAPDHVSFEAFSVLVVLVSPPVDALQALEGCEGPSLAVHETPLVLPLSIVSEPSIRIVFLF
jgi:hypothetical protein